MLILHSYVICKGPNYRIKTGLSSSVISKIIIEDAPVPLDPIQITLTDTV